MSLTSSFVRLLAIGSLGLIASSQSAEAACEGQVFFRLWQQSGETWFDAGQEIQIQSGQQGHIYIHVKGRGQQPYTTNASVGYPGEYGYQGDALVVERSVRMQAQNGEDRNNGRIRFNADQQGLVYLGYRINGVTPPGSLNSVPGNCRVGAIPIRVVGAPNSGGGRGDGGRGGGRGDNGDDYDRGDRGGGDDYGRGDRGDNGGAHSGRGNNARDLVVLLYEGILRREDAGQIDEGYVRLVQREGVEGLTQATISMLKSNEFHDQALRRTEAEHGRSRDREKLTDALLWDIYSDLYGRNEPQQRKVDQDYDDLASCLDGRSRACDSLGRNLIGSRLFLESNSRLVRSLN